MFRVVGDQRILRGVPATLSWQALDADGDEADPGTVTVAVSSSDGTSLLAAATATSGTDTDPRTVALPANKNTQVDLLTATWTTTGGTFTTHIEVVGGFYFSVNEARNSDPTLTDQGKYLTSEIVAARREVEDEFERICGVAFVPRYALETLDVVNPDRVQLGWGRVTSIRSLAYYSLPSNTAFTTTEMQYMSTSSAGRLSGRYGFSFEAGENNLIAGYEHGYERPPADVKRAALTRLRHRLNFNKTGIPDRATNFTVAEGGTFTLSTAGPFSTGIPDIDAVLDRYTMRHPGIG